MKGITTIAALPNGAGQAAHLKPEVHSARELLPLHPAHWHRNAYLIGGAPNFTFTVDVRLTDAGSSALKAALKASPIRKSAIKCQVKFA